MYLVYEHNRFAGEKLVAVIEEYHVDAFFAAKGMVKVTPEQLKFWTPYTHLNEDKMPIIYGTPYEYGIKTLNYTLKKIEKWG